MTTEAIDQADRALSFLRAVAMLREDVLDIAKNREFPTEVRRAAKEAISDFEAAALMPAEYRKAGRTIRVR